VFVATQKEETRKFSAVSFPGSFLDCERGFSRLSPVLEHRSIERPKAVISQLMAENTFCHDFSAMRVTLSELVEEDKWEAA
jgi:hypothetical protein